MLSSLFAVVLLEAAEAAEGETPGTLSDAVLVDDDAGAEAAATDAFVPGETHVLRWMVVGVGGSCCGCV